LFTVAPYTLLPGLFLAHLSSCGAFCVVVVFCMCLIRYPDGASLMILCRASMSSEKEG
jgi:hypothetical protein